MGGLHFLFPLPDTLQSKRFFRYTQFSAEINKKTGFSIPAQKQSSLFVEIIMPQEYPLTALQSLLQEYHFGLESIRLYDAILRDRELVALEEDILIRAYHKFFGECGSSFVGKVFNRLKCCPNDQDFSTLASTILALREEFRTSSMHTIYHNSFRTQNLETSVRLAGYECFTGTVVDIGADDNVMGKVILDHCRAAERVIGVDIERRTPLEIGDQLIFRVQTNPQTVPVLAGEAQTVVCRYSFHHMRVSEQTAILQEIRRILAKEGHFIIFENSWSVNIPALCNEYGFHDRLLNLRDPSRIRLLIAALDIFSHAIKPKEIPFPYTYYCVEKWEQVFKNNGFCANKVNYYGMPLVDLHQSPLCIFDLSLS